MDMPTILFSPLKVGVPASGGSLDMLVRVQAPDRPVNTQAQMPSKRLALVVDRSGSMSGQPLYEALRCVEYIASRLTQEDALSLVVYDNKVQVLLPLQPMREIENIRDALDRVEVGGSTDLHAGWLAGAQQLDGSTLSAISRVLLLSDGKANSGLTEPTAIEAQCEEWLARGVTTTTVGLGRNFNEDLMIGMARAGGGQHYYGQTATDLFDGFDEELALLQALYMRQGTLQLVPAPGVMVEMLSPVQPQANGHWPVRDLAWGAERWLAVRLHLSASAPGSLRELLGARVYGVAMDGATLQRHAPLLQLPALDADAWATLPQDEIVHTRLEELAFAQAAQELRRLAQLGNPAALQQALVALRARFERHPWLQAKVEQLGQLANQDLLMMLKEARYASARMESRLTAKQDMAYVGDEMESMEIPSYLRKKIQEGRGRQDRR